MDDIYNLNASVPFSPAYSLFVVIGILLLLVFPVTKNISHQHKRSYYLIQLIMLFGAILGAKLAVLMGDALWPLLPFHNWKDLFFSGRSIVGALLFGFLFSEIAKPLMNYRLPPNDRFAIILPFSIATGRFGCYLAGCCRGIPYDGVLSITYDDHVQRHASQLYEMTFHIFCGLFFLYLYRNKRLPGRIFALYMVLYGIFRFFTEYLRVTEKVFWDYSAYQLFSLCLVAAGIFTLYARRNVTANPLYGDYYAR